MVLIRNITYDKAGALPEQTSGSQLKHTYIIPTIVYTFPFLLETSEMITENQNTNLSTLTLHCLLQMNLTKCRSKWTARTVVEQLPYRDNKWYNLPGSCKGGHHCSCSYRTEWVNGNCFFSNIFSLNCNKDLILTLHNTAQFGGDMEELDDAGTYYNMGLRRITIPGVYNYMCTRNNNFSNRSQKGEQMLLLGRCGSASPPHQSKHV